MLAVSRTISHDIGPRQSVMGALSIIAALPFRTPLRIWRDEAEEAGVYDLESAIRAWADANAALVYVESDDTRIEVILRESHRTVCVLWMCASPVRKVQS